MAEWLQEWGKRPERRVLPPWWPPSLILRQLGSALYVAVLARWRELPRWILTYGWRCVPGAAGSRGMGCIGFPAHPVWEMTTACNLRCRHCHASGGSPAADELTTREAKRLLDQLAETREFRMMAFTGGEPLVRRDLFELLAYSRSLGFTNTLATNATLIDETGARRFRQRGVVIGTVSLDGYDASTHGYVRNQPVAFGSALRGIRALRNARIPLHVNITAMDYNMDRLAPVGRRQSIEDAALDLGANERLMRFLAHAKKRIKAISEPEAGP